MCFSGGSQEKIPTKMFGKKYFFFPMIDFQQLSFEKSTQWKAIYGIFLSWFESLSIYSDLMKSVGFPSTFFRFARISFVLEAVKIDLIICLSCLFHFLISKLFIMIPIIGATRKNIIFLEERLGLTKWKPSYRLTGTHHSPRSVSVWRSTKSSGSLSSTRRQIPCTHLFGSWQMEVPDWSKGFFADLLQQRGVQSLPIDSLLGI